MKTQTHGLYSHLSLLQKHFKKQKKEWTEKYSSKLWTVRHNFFTVYVFRDLFLTGKFFTGVFLLG